MEIDLAILADAATVDSSGKLNILGVYDRLTAEAFPAPPLRLTLVLRFTASVSEVGPHSVVITLKGPNGKEMLRVDGEMVIAPGPGATADGIHVPQILNVDGIIFERPGRFFFDIGIDGAHHASVPLHVVDMGNLARA
jgi:hypothetical protein